MPVKVTKNLKNLKMVLPTIKRTFNKGIKANLPDYIKDDIEAGVSPVRGARFQKYSQSYRDQIDSSLSGFGKKKSPVNMKLSGQMLSTLTGKIIKGDVKIRISDKLADIHNRIGAGKSRVVRRLLPTNNGEEFNRNISGKIEDLLIKIVNNTIRLANRR